MSASDHSPNPPEPNPEERTVTVAPPAPPPVTPARADDETGTLLPASQAPGDRPAETIHAPAPPSYELLAEIGRGGMGVVYKARQRGLNRLVALKVVLAGGHASAAQRLRFLAEAEAVAALNHPGIIGVYEFGTLDGQPYMALEYCPGGTLADRLRGTPLRPRDAAELIERVARAVATAHERGVVHRDLKPANILLAADGTPKITDFGLAKMMDQLGSLTVTGAVMGTPSYMAPEQARGDAKTVGPPADVYALGAVLYECLTGRPPFRGANPADTIVQSLEREPVGVRALNPTVPVDLETVCLKCLEKESSRRYPHAAAFADDLARFVAGRPVVARPVGPLGRARRWVGRNQVVTGLLVTIVLAVAAGTTATYTKYLDEAAQHAVAEQQREKAEAETAAKEEALQKLRQTLGALEALAEEQKKTLDRVRVEKAATEDALLRGLLRPLRNQSDNVVTREEARVLFEAAALPEERLRFRFVERGLATAEDAEKLTAWRHEVVAAAVGLDRAAAVRLRGAVGRILRAPTTTPEARVACAALAAALPTDDPDFILAAARGLADQMTAERDPTAFREPSELLRALAPHLRPADAAQVARPLIDRTARESDLAALGSLGLALEALARRLDPAEAAALAPPLVERMDGTTAPTLAAFVKAASDLSVRAGPDRAEAFAASLSRSLCARLSADKDAAALYNLTSSLAQSVARLNPGSQTRVVGPVLRALAARIAVESDASFISQIDSSAGMLAPRAAPTDVVSAATALIDRTRAEKDPGVLSSLGTVLATLAPHLPAADVTGLARALADRAAAEPDANVARTLTMAVEKCAELLPPDQAADLVRPLAFTVADRILVERDSRAASDTDDSLSYLARFLTPSDAAAVAKALVERLATERDTNVLTFISISPAAVAARLDPRDAAPYARILAARLATEKDTTIVSTLSGPLAELAGRLPADEAARLFRPVVRYYVGRAVSDRDSAQVNRLSALQNLARRATAADASAAARRLAARIVTERDGNVASALVSTFLALAERVGGDEEAALIAAVGSALRDRLAGGQSAYIEQSPGYSQLAPRLTPDVAAAHARAFVSRLATEREPNVHFALVGLIREVAARLEPADAAAITRSLTARLDERTSEITRAVWYGVEGLAPRLAAEDAAPLAREAVRRLVAGKETANADTISGSFAALVVRLSEADLFSLLKSNVHYPQIRTRVLAEFGRRSGRAHTTPAFAVAGAPGVVAVRSPAFGTVWEFVDWAEGARPNQFDFVPGPTDPTGPGVVRTP